MSRANRIKSIVAGLLVLLGLLLALLPKKWIEESFGFEPDAGSGALELALVLIPIAIGVLLAASVLLSHRHQRMREAPN